MRPRLIHPILFKFRELDRDKSVYNSTTREAKQRVRYKPAITLKGQVNFAQAADNMVKKQTMTATGDAEASTVSIIFLKDELDKHCITIRKNDLITEMDGETIRLFVTLVDPFMHYKTRTAYRVMCSDRQPR